jgi:phosphate transport system substrate-binding protein
MSETDRQLCRANGREPVEFQIGTDALAIAVSSQNDFVQDVSAEELQQILAGAATWSAVRPEWPNQAINRYYPTEESGTFESLVEIMFDGDKEAVLNAANLKLQSERDEELVAGIQNDPLAVGFFGYAYYERNKDKLQTLPVQGVRPRPETVDQKSYPLLRSLFIYSTAQTIQQKPQVAAFINYYLGSVKNYVSDVGYFLPDEDTLQQSIQNLNEVAQ